MATGKKVTPAKSPSVTATAKKKAARKKTNKGLASKVIYSGNIFNNELWTVCYGELKKPSKPGPKPKETEHLFRIVGEKLPFDALKKIRNDIKSRLGKVPNGVYVAHDSMGCPRYIGRGNIFGRLEARKAVYQLELEYFSFYVVAEKKHEREVETLLIRAAGFLVELNTLKKRIGIGPGNIKDYEPGTLFYERHYKKGKKPAAKKKLS
jgi:hypothetical protein